MSPRRARASGRTGAAGVLWHNIRNPGPQAGRGHSAWPRCSTGRVERTDGHQDARITGQRTLV